jgi:hypothetical protein
MERVRLGERFGPWSTCPTPRAFFLSLAKPFCIISFRLGKILFARNNVPVRDSTNADLRESRSAKSKDEFGRPFLRALIFAVQSTTVLTWNDHELFLGVGKSVQAFDDFFVGVAEHLRVMNDDDHFRFRADLNKSPKLLLIV